LISDVRQSSPGRYGLGEFFCGKIRHFSTISTGFSTHFAKKPKKKRGKALFYRKTVWKTRVKLWNTHFLPKNLWKTTRFSSAAPQTEERCL
jgi:hypothetical protein